MDKSCGWLVNDCLTRIPGTKTLWHDLLEWIPSLKDMTFGGTSFSELPSKVEEASIKEFPSYILRNATYFRPLEIKTKTFSLMQDIRLSPHSRNMQLSVCLSSDLIIFNSEYIKSKFPEIKKPSIVIPLGVDFEFFKPSGNKEEKIVFIGSSEEYPKGYSLLLEIIEKSSFNFHLILKDGGNFVHPRVQVHNKINAEKVRDILQTATALVCTSHDETQHLAGIEAAACGVPVITTPVGIYLNHPKQPWGEIVEKRDASMFVDAINRVLRNYSEYSPREYMQKFYSKDAVKKQWVETIKI